jgi:hypothetical protein
MGRAPRQEPPPGGASGLALPDAKGTLKAYYAGARMMSPMGGVLMVLGLQRVGDGSSRLILECNTSSLRYELPIRAATRTEKSKVKQALEAGADPTCPRHGRGQRLVRAGAYLVCPACGIPFQKAS